MDIDTVRRMLSAQAERHGVVGLSRLWDVDMGYISRVMHGKQHPGISILDNLGLEKVVSYRRKYSKPDGP